MYSYETCIHSTHSSICRSAGRRRGGTEEGLTLPLRNQLVHKLLNILGLATNVHPLVKSSVLWRAANKNEGLTRLDTTICLVQRTTHRCHLRWPSDLSWSTKESTSLALLPSFMPRPPPLMMLLALLLKSRRNSHTHTVQSYCASQRHTHTLCLTYRSTTH